MANEILEGFQVGLNASLRIQELQSQRAAQAARERAVAQEMAIMMEKRNEMIQYRADMAKAMGATKMQTSESVPVFGPSGVVGTVPNPNPMSPEDATFQNIIPVIAKYEPDKVPAALQALATARYRQGQETRLNKQEERLSKGTTPGMASPLGKEVADYQYFIQSGNTEAAEFAKAALLKRGTDTGFQIQFGPNGEVQSISQGPKGAGGGGLTTGALTDIQKKSQGVDAAISELRKLQQMIPENRDAFGIRGAAGEILESARSQLNLSDEAKARISNVRHQAGMTFSSVAESLRVDSGNMSRYELSQLERLGDTRTIGTSWTQARDRTENLLNLAIAKKLRIFKSTKEPVPDSFIQEIPPSEVPGLAQEGLLSLDEAMRWYDMRKQ